MNTQEYWEKHVLFASRQNQPAGYGFYFPAIDEHEDEDTLNSKMVCVSYYVTVALIALFSFIACRTHTKYLVSLIGSCVDTLRYRYIYCSETLLCLDFLAQMYILV
jgi:hypothetical protein